MRISINWIKDFVDLDGIETEELIKRFNTFNSKTPDFLTYKGMLVKD